MVRAVLDVNVVVSGLLNPHGSPVRDPKDQYLVALAIPAHATFLISGDDDLLAVANDLRPYGVEVVTPARFDEILDEG